MKKSLVLWPMLAATGLACLIALASGAALGAEGRKRPVNLLFLITDEQRFDALGCAGNRIVKTANLDRLAQEGARFEKAYTFCPVCSPARTVILTGHNIDTIKIFNNGDITLPNLPHPPTFDEILLRHGYQGEYHGKYHSPYHYALEYTYPVRWGNGKRPPGCKSDDSQPKAFAAYVAAHVPARPLRPGEHIANLYGCPYLPDPVDPSYGKTQAEVAQASSYGCIEVPPDCTLTGFVAKEGLEALERLKGGPFTLTISISPPHPPMVVNKPYYRMYQPASIPIPASIDDPLSKSPYAMKGLKDTTYRNQENVRQMISDYYGLVTEVDDWVGRILHRLDELGLADHTLVVFTSDHGDMLGDHGMTSKMKFYEGADHIPLLMRLPGDSRRLRGSRSRFSY